MKTIAQIIRKAKLDDVIVAGKLKWIITDTDFDGCVIATPANKFTKFELWSKGMEEVSIIPGLKVVK